MDHDQATATKMEQAELGAVKPTDDSSPSNSTCTRRRMWMALAGTLLLGGIIAISVYFASRPENLEVVESQAQETLPSLIKVAQVGEGAVLIEYTESLDDPTTLNDPTKLFYYVTVQDLDLESLLPNAGDINMYLTRSANPTVTDIDDDSVLIENVAQTEFPYRLADGILPGDLNGVLFVEESNDGTTLEIATGGFSLIVDATQNLASPTTSPSPSPAPSSKSPVTAPEPGTPTTTLSPSPAPSSKSPVATPEPGTPTAMATSRPTDAPTTPRPTNAPTTPAPVMNSPTDPPLPPILISSLEGEYDISGTITINYITNFVGGQVVNVPRMQFDIPQAAGAPGPFLYLSKRPYSETKNGRLTSSDIYIPIDEIGDGSFTVEGRYDQVLDEVDDVQDLQDYTNGSWIVWCEPFSVWLGGGPIAPQ